ncbi:uncharacterized protein [Montipora foliosa]|uniref:uncharacterized protein n=1 Tax=Montipora foliosa TaxID=591990 RepID=UPI0035F166BC
MEPYQIVDVTDKLKFRKRPNPKFNTSLLSIINDFVPRTFAQTDTFASAGGAERHKMLITLSWVFVFTVNAFSISKEDPVSRNFLVEVLKKKLTSPASEYDSPSSDPSVTFSHCPENLFASCMLLPPFVTWNLTSSKNQTREGNGTVYQIDGILPHILKFGLNICCAAHEESETVVSYKHDPVYDKSELHKAIMKDEVNLIFPVQSDDDKEYKKYFPYLKLFESPGIVLIIRRQDSISRGIQNWSAAVRNCWPIVVLSVLLSIVAGICVWALETKKNTQEFRSPFYLGIFDGFWWSFVTMATVGYGDKTPKSLVAQLFSVIWIMIGITLCSMLTATLSSAFTNVTVDYYGVLSGRKVGVVKNSIALQKAVELGANVEVFKDLDEVHNALVNKSVDGLLEEIFTANEYLALHENSSLSMIHFYEEKHGYGIAFKSYVKADFGSIWECMSFVSSFIAEDKYAFLRDHIHRAKRFKTTKDASGLKAGEEIDPQNWPVFAGTVICFCGIALLFLTVNVALKWFRGRCVKGKEEDTEEGREPGQISGQTSQWSQYEKHLEFSVTELISEPFNMWHEQKH